MRRFLVQLRCRLFGHVWGGWVPLMMREDRSDKRAMRQCYGCHDFEYQYAESRDFVSDAFGWPEEMVD